MSQMCDIGIIGLGTMGSNLALNIVEHGFPTAVFNRNPLVTKMFIDKKPPGAYVQACYSLQEIVNSLQKPRRIMLMIKAGQAIDEVFGELSSLLEKGDILIDGGNSYFKDTERRAKALAQQGIIYMGVGISGGEHGARYGPSIMVGGLPDGYLQVQPIFESIAAKFHGKSCVAHLGLGAVGHYVKMVHNAIEYGLMELIAESYDVMSRGLGLQPSELQQVYSEWNQTELSSFLLEITAEIFGVKDDNTDGYLIEKIVDTAMQKGTGMWNSEEAMAIQIPIPTLDIGVTMRNLSALKKQRIIANASCLGPNVPIKITQDVFIGQVKNALYAGMIITFTQGMAQLFEASKVHGYGLYLEDVASIWRGGCIIRTQLLDKIKTAYSHQPELANLLLDDSLRQPFEALQEDLRAVVCAAVEAGIPVPGFMSCIAYFDAYRSLRLPVNLIQAQRDYFGAHHYERIDREGQFHTNWKAGD